MASEMTSAQKIFYSFLGFWQVSRKIGCLAEASGKASFSLEGSRCIAYREEMKMKNYISSRSYKAYREYVYYYDEKRDQIYVTFSDGRFFYHLELDEHSYLACGEHVCNSDHYKANYSFFNNAHFSLCYEIVGCKKNYIIESDFIAFR